MTKGWFRTQNDALQPALLRQIGPNGFTIWSLIKRHADLNTGLSWPSMRYIREATGLRNSSINTAIAALQAAHMLRIETPGKGTRATRYIARERLDIWLGSRRICTAVIDYIPTKFSEQLKQLESDLKGDAWESILTHCQILPGDGFHWDAATNTFRAEILLKEAVDNPVDNPVNKLLNPDPVKN
jgi:hypothetical protein